MARWKTRDIATFEHNTDSGSTIIGEVRCLICDWTAQPNSPTIFPTVDNVVEEHVRATHVEILNDAGVQRSPEDDLLVYYVVENP